jgi:hypothetical protein
MKSGLTVTHPPSMIQSTSNSDAAGRTQALAAAEAQSALHAPMKRDRLSTAGADYLRAALQAQPEIRPEVVERGRALAADPTYPTPEIIQRISEKIVRSPDPADENS